MKFSLYNSIEHSPSLEGKRFLASLEIPKVLWSLHFTIHSGLPLVRTVSQVNAVHIIISLLMEKYKC